jgi:uncharacterized membrane protein
MLSIFRKKKPEFFSPDEKALIVEAVKKAEQQTSGEVRVYIESRCRFVNAIDRAAEVFYQLQMQNTQQRNAVLVYIAMKDRQLAVYGDEGIHAKVGQVFWQQEVKTMLHLFKQSSFGAGIAQVVTDIGKALHQHFPYQADTDKNELPDDIVFGK